MRLAECLAAFRGRDLPASLQAAAEFLDVSTTGSVLRQLVSPSRARRLVELGLELDHAAFLGEPCAASRVKKLADQIGCSTVRSFRSRVLALELGVPTRIHRLTRGEQSIEIFVPKSKPRRCPSPAHVAFRTPELELDTVRRILARDGFRVPAAFPEEFIADGDGARMMYFDKVGMRVEVFARGVL